MTDERLVAAYAAATWRVRTPTGTCLLRIGESSTLSRCGIVTAYNPASSLRPAAANREANRRLHRDLRSLTDRICPAVARGHGEDSARWREPGLAVGGIGLARLVELGERYGQNAIVWIAASGIPRLVASRDGFAGHPIGTFL